MFQRGGLPTLWNGWPRGGPAQCACWGPSPGNVNGLRSVAGEGLRGSEVGSWVAVAFYLDSLPASGLEYLAMCGTASNAGWMVNLTSAPLVRFRRCGSTGNTDAEVSLSRAGMHVALAWWDGTNVNLQVNEGTPSSVLWSTGTYATPTGLTFDIGERSDANGGTFESGCVFAVAGSDAEVPTVAERAAFWPRAATCLGWRNQVGVSVGEGIGLEATHKWVAHDLTDLIASETLSRRGTYPDSYRMFAPAY